MEPIEEPKVRKPTPREIDFNIIYDRLDYELESAKNTYSLDAQNRWPPKKYYAQHLPNPTQDQMQEACDKANEDARDKANRKFFKHLEKIIERAKEQSNYDHPEEDGGEWRPIGWMVDVSTKAKAEKTKKVRKMLNETKFDVMMTYLMEITRDPAASEELAKHLPSDRRVHRMENGQEWPRTLLAPDKTVLAARLGMTESSAQKYIQAAADITFLTEQGRKPGRDGVKIYSMGHRDDFCRRLPWKSSDEWLEKLGSFRVGKGGRKHD